MTNIRKRQLSILGSIVLVGGVGVGGAGYWSAKKTPLPGVQATPPRVQIPWRDRAPDDKSPWPPPVNAGPVRPEGPHAKAVTAALENIFQASWDAATQALSGVPPTDDTADAMERLARGYWRADRIQEARAWTKKLAHEDSVPENPSELLGPRLRAARLYAEQDDVRATRVLFTALRQAQTEWERDLVMRALAEQAAQRGDTETAHIYWMNLQGKATTEASLRQRAESWLAEYNKQ